MNDLLKRSFRNKIDDLLIGKYGLMRCSSEWSLAKRKITTLRKKNGERFYGEYPDYWAWLVAKSCKKDREKERFN